MPGASFSELPHELWDQIAAHITTARDLSHLSQTNKALHEFVEGEGWAIFIRSHFPWCTGVEFSWKSTARSLTSVSRAWDRRAFIARSLQPSGHVFAYPGGHRRDAWKMPTGQTMGFAPRLDAYTPDSNANTSTDVLAFTAGAQICLRKQIRKLGGGRKMSENVTWSTYLPLSARQGLDDVTSINLLAKPFGSPRDEQELISGTANGDLQHLSIPFEGGESAVKSYFTTQGLPVQATSIIQGQDQDQNQQPLLAAALGNTDLALYTIDSSQSKIAPSSTLRFGGNAEVHPAFGRRSCRVWTVQFLSRDLLATGIGRSEMPLQLCTIRPTGLDPALVRSFKLKDENGHLLKANSVSAIMPMSGNKQTFLSGAYDGLVRLHDLRAPEDVQTHYSVPNYDNAIYSLLARGQHTLLAGTSRHDMMHVFDIRARSGRYCYLDTLSQEPHKRPPQAYSLFMPTDSRRRQGASEGSVYSLASGSIDSPIVYAGLQNTVLEIAVTEIDHPHPDLLHFRPWPSQKKLGMHQKWNGWGAESIKLIGRLEGNVLSKQTDTAISWQMSQRTQLRRVDDGLDIRWLKP